MVSTDKTNFIKLYDGECKFDCSQTCSNYPKEYRPICAENSQGQKTFDLPCDLTQQNCQSTYQNKTFDIWVHCDDRTGLHIVALFSCATNFYYRWERHLRLSVSGSMWWHWHLLATSCSGSSGWWTSTLNLTCGGNASPVNTNNDCTSINVSKNLHNQKKSIIYQIPKLVWVECNDMWYHVIT